ncbi:hypothetical protein CR513_56238, partial [Mucuna pruriens]
MKRKIGGGKQNAIEQETTKLKVVHFIREVSYTTWLSDVVLVKKSNGKWWMCIDYVNLNKACPKDFYRLLSIDRLVDGASGFQKAGATYQCLMVKVFAKHISHNLEVYVDDMVIKSLDPKEHIEDLEEIFS